MVVRSSMAEGGWRKGQQRDRSGGAEFRRQELYAFGIASYASRSSFRHPPSALFFWGIFPGKKSRRPADAIYKQAGSANTKIRQQ
jgi:hypothetical protein